MLGDVAPQELAPPLFFDTPPFREDDEAVDVKAPVRIGILPSVQGNVDPQACGSVHRIGVPWFPRFQSWVEYGQSFAARPDHRIGRSWSFPRFYWIMRPLFRPGAARALCQWSIAVRDAH